MRKRLFIGAIAAVVIGVAAYVLSQQKEGTAEYHEKQYRKIRQVSAVDRLVFTRGPQWLRQAWINRRQRRLFYHHDALLRLGYFEQRVFSISNQPPLKIVRAVYSQAGFTVEDFSRVTGTHTNSITVLASSDEMAKWEELIPKADVPEGGQ